MPVSQSTLNEESRSKLDGIVSKMQENGESEDNIRFVVDDFKAKYSEKKNESLPSKPSATPSQSPAQETDDRFSFDKVLNPNKQEGNAPLPQPVTPKVAPKKSEKYLEANWMKAADPQSLKEKPEGVAPIKSAATGFASVISSSLKSIAIAAKRYDFFNEYTDKKTEDLVTYKAGKWVDETVKDLVGEATPEQQEQFGTKLFTAVGQMGGFMLGGLGGKVMKMSPALTTAALGAAVGGASEYEAAVQSGVTEDQAAKAFWINAALNTTEGLPFMSMFRKMDKYTGGLATGLLAKKLSSTVGGRLTNEIAGGIAGEVAQEVGVQALSNVTATNTYDATRKWYDVLVETGGISAIIGGSMSGVAVAIRNKRAQGGLTKQEDAQLAAAEQFAQEKADEALDPNKESVSTPTAKSEKVKAIVKAKTDLEADLAHSTTLPEGTKAAMQSEVEDLDQNLEAAKEEVYQQELDSKEAKTIQADIDRNLESIKDETLSESTKAIIQKQIQEDTERLQSLNVSPQDDTTSAIAEPLQADDSKAKGQTPETVIPRSTNEVGQGEPTSTASVLEPKVVEPSNIKKEVGTIYIDSDGKEKVIVQVNKDGSFLIKDNGAKSQNPTLGNESDLSKVEPSIVNGEDVKVSEPKSEKGKAAINEAISRKSEIEKAGFDFLENEDNPNPTSDTVAIGNVGINASEHGKGLGTLGYILKGEEYLKQGKYLVSKPEGRTAQAEGVWKKLVKLGLAEETSEGNYKYGGEREQNKPIQSEEAKAEVPNTQKKADTTNEEANTIEPAAEKVTGEGSGEPPKGETVNIPVGDGKEIIGMTHAEFGKIAEEVGIEGYEKNPQTVKQWNEESDKKISNGELPKLLKRLEEGSREITAVEQFMLGKYVAGLKFEWNKTKSDATLLKIKKALEYSNASRSEAGKVLRAGLEMLPVHPLETGDLASAMVAKMEANNTDVLTDKQKAEVEAQVSEYKKRAEEADIKIAEMEKLHQEMLAQQEINNTKAKGAKKTTTTAKKTTEDFAKERKDITDSIKEKVRKARGETSAIVIPYAKELIAITPDVLKLAKSYVEEGVIKLSDIVSKAHSEMKEYLHEIKEEDIRDIIAGKYNEKKATKNELQAQWYDLQQEAKLLNEYDRVLKGEPKTEKETRRKNELLTELRKKIDAKKLEETAAEKHENKIKGLEAELERVRGRKSKEKVEKGAPKEKVVSEEEQQVVDKINNEQAKWNDEKDDARQVANDYKKLETERNRQLKRVADLKEKLAVLQSGKLPDTKTNTPKVDVPEIEALKKEIDVAEKAVRESNAHEKKMTDLETELQRIKDRSEKAKKPEIQREISDEEKLKRAEIEAEQKAWDIEKNIEKLNQELQRVKDRKQKVTTPKERGDLTAVEEGIAKQIKAEKEVWAKEVEPERKLRQAVKNAEKSLEEYERRIAAKDTTPKGTNPVKETPELKALRDKIKEAKERYEKVRKETGAASAQKLRNMVASNDRAAAKLLQRIADEDFAPEKPKSFHENTELKRQHPDLYNQVLNAINRKEEAKHKFDIANAMDAAEKESKGMKAWKGAGRLKNTFQQLAAGVDDSLMFVQLGHTLLRNPSTAINFKKITDANGKTKFVLGGAIKEHVLDAISKKRFNEQMTALHNNPAVWPLIKASGLDVLEPQSLLAQMKEEMFQHSYADKLGTKNLNLGTFLQIWERAYTSLGNNVRVDLFLRQAKGLYAKGLTIENNLAEFQGLAKAINNLTGRGTTTPKMAQMIPFVTPVIWSPKMIASSINLLGLTDITGKGAGFYSKLPPKARAYAISQMAGGIGTGVAIMMAAAIGGAIVHYDPRDAKFGEVMYGDDDEKSFNVFGRYAGYIKLLVQMMPFIGGRLNSKGESVSVYDEGGKVGGEVLGGFTRGKMNPVSGLMYDYALNDKKGFYDKKPMTLKGAGQQLMIPMSLRNIGTELERDGTASLLTYALPNFVGIQMKDSRDFPVTEMFSKKDLELNVFKVLSEKGVELPKRGSVKQYKVDINDKHPEGLMTDTEFNIFNNYRKMFMMQGGKTASGDKFIGLDDLIEKSKAIVREFNQRGAAVSTKRVEAKDLDKALLEKEVSEIAEKASAAAMMEMKLRTPKNKIEVDIRTQK